MSITVIHSLLVGWRIVGNGDTMLFEDAADARRESLHLARVRYEGGLTSETAFRQAQVELARTATLVPDLERKISLKENEIAFLSGEYPHHIKRSVLPEDVMLSACEANAHCKGAATTTSAIARFDHCSRNDNFVFILL